MLKNYIILCCGCDYDVFPYDVLKIKLLIQYIAYIIFNKTTVDGHYEPTATQIINQYSRESTPILIVKKQSLEKSCASFAKSFPLSRIFYSIKANSDKRVLEIVSRAGLDFDIATSGELKMLKELGVMANRIIYSAPTKLSNDIREAYEYGVNLFAFDSEIEVDKLTKFAPGSQVVLRLVVDNEGSEWPLARKFGVEGDEVIKLSRYAESKGLHVAGLTFHVGSQNTKKLAWSWALERVWASWLELKRQGINIQFINIGGGFPVVYSKSVVALSDIAKSILSYKDKLFGKDIDIWVEPGRGLVAESGFLLTSVINRARRASGDWLYLDAGVFNGLYEAVEGFRFPIYTNAKGRRRKRFVLCGPSCDSMDKVMEDALLPSGVTYGDKLLFCCAGAYTTAMEHYNGLAFPDTIIAY